MRKYPGDMWKIAISSIRQKLTLVMTAVCALVLLLAAGAFVVSDIVRIRSSKVEQLTALADLLALNGSPALSSGQAQAAEDLLASLQSQPTVEHASLLEADGRVLATYPRSGDKAIGPSVDEFSQYRYTEDGYLEILRPVFDKGEQIGSIYLRASMDDLKSQITKDIAFASVALIVSLGISAMLCFHLQRIISEPIVHLTQTAQQVSAQGDYSLRTRIQSSDELGILCHEFNRMLRRIQLGEQELRKAHDHLEDRVDQRTKALAKANVDLKRQIEERQRTECELQKTHEQLVDAARLAGKAEIATSVLHNVGNVLNSVIVSASLIRERLQQSRVNRLQRALAMLDEHASDLGTYLTHDDKGKVLPRYLVSVGNELVAETAETNENLESLISNIDHIKSVVSMQQTVARVSGVIQRVSLARLLDDAMQLQRRSFERHNIRVVCEYEDLPEVNIDKHRLFEIVVNLIENAKDSLLEGGQDDSQVVVRCSANDGDRLRIDVRDNGVGIAEENLTKIFTHGFTTKKDGHGFGLHGCANAAKEMGGTLSVQSEGVGRGATFSVEVPTVSA